MAKELYDGIYSSHKSVFIERIENNIEHYLKDKIISTRKLGQEILCEITRSNLYDVLKEIKNNPEIDIQILNSINRYISQGKNYVLINLSSVENNFSMTLKVMLNASPDERLGILKECKDLITEISGIFKTADSYLARTDLKESQWDIVIENQMLDGLDSYDLYIKTDYDIIDEAFISLKKAYMPGIDILHNIDFMDLLTYISRFDYNAGIFPELCLCLALEDLMQLKTPKRVQYIRMILCELNRISSHLYFISNMARIVDSEIILNQTLIARETVLRIIEFITGSRIHPNFIRIGGVRKNLNDEKTNAIKDIIPQIQDSVTRIESNVFNNMVINAKLKNTGNASIEQALNLGVTGPNLRACGARYDLRKNRNFLLYKDASFIISTGKYGDCLERTCMRFREIYQSIKIISQVIDDIPDERIKKLINLSDLEIPFTEMISTVECPHGAFKVFFEIKDNIILNLIIMGPSRNSLFLAEKILPGNRVEDIELILSSLDISSGEIIMEHAI